VSGNAEVRKKSEVGGYSEITGNVKSRNGNAELGKGVVVTGYSYMSNDAKILKSGTYEDIVIGDRTTISEKSVFPVTHHSNHVHAIREYNWRRQAEGKQNEL
jgi:acyl-[acyl carrier protein]--UDP-N-acetylglucosamine O-acyltransferase